jgi:hypothetical protein
LVPEVAEHQSVDLGLGQVHTARSDGSNDPRPKDLRDPGPSGVDPSRLNAPELGIDWDVTIQPALSSCGSVTIEPPRGRAEVDQQAKLH